MAMGAIHRQTGERDWDGVEAVGYDDPVVAGVEKRELIGPADGAPHYRLRHFHVPAGGRTFTVEDPATGEALTEVADASPDDAMAAVAAASEAQGSWAATPPRQRSDILRRGFELLRDRFGIGRPRAVRLARWL